MVPIIPTLPEKVGQSSQPKYFTTEFVFTILFAFAGYLLPIGDYVPLEVNIAVCCVAVALAVYTLWKWEKVKDWAIAKKIVICLVVMLAYVSTLGLGLNKQYATEYNMNLSFKEYPAFTWWMELRVTWNFAKARDYLKSLTIPINPETPPIDIVYSNAGSVASLPKPTYREAINIGAAQLKESRGQTRAYVFYQMAYVLPKPDNSAPFGRQGAYLRQVNDFSDYFNAAIWDKPDSTWAETDTGWPAKLWDMRERFGKRFTDQVVAYTLKSLHDAPEEGASDDPDTYFCRHLKIGEDRVDHEASKWPEILDILGRNYRNVCR
jgi:hypothetical protein